MEGAFETDAQITLFGFDASPAKAKILHRSRAWRVGGAARTLGIFVLVAPFAAIFPPHAVWPIGALLTGSLLARRRFIERVTLVSLDGRCPKCSKAFAIKSTRLRMPHPLPCDACHHESSLRVPDQALEVTE